IFFIKGFFEGTINNGNNSLLVWTHKDRSGPFMNALHFCFGVGALLSPWLYSWYVDVPGSYRWAYCFIAGFAFLAALYMLLIPNSPDPVQGDGDKAESNLKIGVNYPLAVVAALYLFFYVGAEIAFGNWIFTYARTLDLANPVQATLLTSAFWASFTVGRLISIPVAVKVQPRRIILASLFACLVVLGLVMVLPTSEYTVWIMSIALGFFMAPVWPMGFTLVGKVTRLTARTSGIVLLGDSIGGMMLPWLMGVAIVRLGAPMLVYLVFASLMFNLLAFWGVLTLGSAQKQSQSVPA
ncbi:MAG: MFS transporter, partial [Anaerolineales bacterium]|nr:MFS transporter [Anaerolineales bacterium]